jgi:hypothetical protein
MPILDLQRSLRELGRLRMGKLDKPAGGRPRPVKLATWRLTTPWRHLLDAAIEVGINGEVVPWRNPGTDRDEFELITDTDYLEVIVPPGEQVLSQWWELWSGGGAQRRCDGVSMILDNGKTVAKGCRCPKDPDERQAAAVANPPTACRPTTRLNVMLPGLPDLGVWRLESHGFYAAVELAGAATIAETAARRGVLLPAELRIEPRRIKRAGQPVKRFAVPVLGLRGNLGETLDALGMRDGERPVSIASARPALTAGGPAELDAAPASFDRPPDIAPAELPALEVEEPDPFTPPELEPDTRTESTAMPPDRMLAMRAREAGITDDDRRLLYLAITDGRASSGKDLEVADVRAAFVVIDGVRDGHVGIGVTRDGGAFAVYDRRAKRTLYRRELPPDPPASTSTDEEPDPFTELELDRHHEGEAIRPPARPLAGDEHDDDVAEGELVDDALAEEAVEGGAEEDYAEVLEPGDEQVDDASSITGPPPAPPLEAPTSADGWRKLLKDHGIRVIDALKFASVPNLDDVDEHGAELLLAMIAGDR